MCNDVPYQGTAVKFATRLSDRLTTRVKIRYGTSSTHHAPMDEGGALTGRREDSTDVAYQRPTRASGQGIRDLFRVHRFVLHTPADEHDAGIRFRAACRSVRFSQWAHAQPPFPQGNGLR